MDPAYGEVVGILALAAKTARFGIGYQELQRMDEFERGIIRLAVED